MAGKVDFATARCEAALAVRELGFPDLFDWIDDVLNLNAALLSGWRDYTSSLHRAILDHWPAQELYRVSPRATHRQWNGLDRENITDGEPPQGRWIKAGGQLYDGRMIALKDSSVWTKISRFGKPYSPFDFNSGMSTKGVTRAEAKRFGLIDRDRQICLPKLPPPNDLILWEPEEEPADRCDAGIRFMQRVSMSRTLIAESGSEALCAEPARIGLGGKSRVFSERKPATGQKAVSGAKQETRFDLANEKKSRKPA